MLRVGLTGGLRSGKSTVARYLREFGADVLESDELGRELMEPGQPVYAAILRVFGPEVAGPDGRLNRPRLAELAFEGGRLQTLNSIVHPAVIEAQQRWMENVFARDRTAVAVVVSALIFEVERDALASGVKDSVMADWRRRIDRVVVVTAPDDTKIARYAARLSPDGVGSEAIKADARARLTHQIPDAAKAGRADYVIENTGDLSSLRGKVQDIWARLKAESNKLSTSESLK
jgi:dephospho-CoA kinase